MKTTAYTRRDNLIALGVLPCYYLLFNYLLFGATYVRRLDVFIYATLSIVLVLTPLYFLHAIPALYFRQRLPAIRQTWQRMLLSLLAHVVMSWLVVLLFFYGYDWIGFPGYTFDAGRLQRALLLSVVGNVIVNVIHESVYTFERWSQALNETEKLKKANLQSQLDGLKQQVSPHFLFNSLNSLSSLIDEDPGRAEEFVAELASVYRYLLQNNTDELTTLATELRFIRSYFHLQRTRYGNGLTMQIDVADSWLDARIPPLTLQLLVENAIKHNIVSADQPLHIRLATNSAGCLVVSNNLQRKPARTDRQTVLSNGVGLANITTKYRLLSRSAVHIEETNGQFTVTLPLLGQTTLLSEA